MQHVISRRNVLRGGLAAGALATAGGVLESRASATVGPSTLPAPGKSGIDHVVVVMMENRSFDHFLGWLPGANGRQAGLTYVDRYGVPHQTHHLTKYASCSNTDPDHSYEGGRIEYNNGACDGWLRAGENDALAIGYYKQADLGFLGTAAPAWTTCDRYFASVLAETYPNRFYQHAARTDRLHNSMTLSTLPTIWDRLAAKGVSATYYYSDLPFLALWGPKYVPISQQFEKFKVDAAAGTLPAVSFIDPRFNGESDGISGDDHPSADIRAGESFLGEVYQAVTTSPNWGRTVLVINYDEWGGFFDHVPPTNASDVSPATARRGFRVPALVISPRARRNFVAPWTYDHTSVLKMIEWRWGLSPLTPRDRDARNLAEVLDFTRPRNLSAPAITVPTPPPPMACEVPVASSESEWKNLRAFANAHGWSLPS